MDTKKVDICNWKYQKTGAGPFSEMRKFSKKEIETTEKPLTTFVKNWLFDPL